MAEREVSMFSPAKKSHNVTEILLARYSSVKRYALRNAFPRGTAWGDGYGWMATRTIRINVQPVTAFEP
jgi:hypothetical protein